MPFSGIIRRHKFILRKEIPLRGLFFDKKGRNMKSIVRMNCTFFAYIWKKDIELGGRHGEKKKTKRKQVK